MTPCTAVHRTLYPFGRLVLLFAALLLSLPAAAEGLRYRIEGGSGEAQENVRAHLGESPRDEASAQRFLVTVRDRVDDALEAVGIYEHSLELRVDQSVTPWSVTLLLEHGEPLRYRRVTVRLTGAGAGEARLRKIVAEQAPAEGDVAHHGRYEEFKASLLRAARELGYFEADFSGSELRVDPQAGYAEAALAFETGARYRFGELRGSADILSPEILASLSPFARGDPYDQSLLLELRARLLRLGYFNSVVVLPFLEERTGEEIPVAVDLLPAPRHSYEVGVGYSTDTRQRISLQWRSPRLNRWGHSQQTRLRYSPVNPQARVSYNVPLDAAANDLLQLGARLEDNEFGDLESNQRELSLRREVSEGARVWSVAARALNESWNLADDDFDASYLLAGASYSRRSRGGNVVDPSSGLSRFLELELASEALGSDQDILRLRGEVLAVKRFGEHSRFVARGTAGYLWSSSDRPDELPPSLAFFAGGDNSIRGFAYQSVGRQVLLPTLSSRSLVVGGTRLLTGSLEYQHYVTEQWRVALFADGGDAFVESDFDFNAGVGVGLHYMTPLGAVRIEVAYPVTESGGQPRLHINIGAEL